MKCTVPVQVQLATDHADMSGTVSAPQPVQR